MLCFSGRGIGILAFGPTMDAIGARWSFRVGSIIALVTFIFYIIVQQFLPPVKVVTHDEEKDVEVKEPLSKENGDINKPLHDNDKKEKGSPHDKQRKHDFGEDRWMPQQGKEDETAKTMEDKNGVLSNGTVKA